MTDKSNPHDAPAHVTEPGTPPLGDALKPGVSVKLSIMMFLQYFAWGAWFVTLSSFIGSNTGLGELFGEGFVGVAYGTAAIGGMISPFLVGLIADRFFSTERILCVLHLLGAGALFYLTTVDSQSVFYGVLVAFFVCYMPTISLTNSLAFTHLTDPGKQFPRVRVLGTIGWIVAGLIVAYLRFSDGQVGVTINQFLGIPFNKTIVSIADNSAAASIEPTVIPMYIGAIAQVILGLYCLVLPHTPPSAKGKDVSLGSLIGLDALKMMKEWPFAVFVIGSFLVTIPLQFYYNYTNWFLKEIGVEEGVGKMTYGQMSEIFFMLLMPLFLARLGVKYMLLIGMACWALRYLLFAYGDAGDGMWMLYAGILLHGICYDFFFVTGYIYVENKADASIRGAAQGFITFVTLGLGGFIGANLSGWVQAQHLTPEGVVPAPYDWTTFWLIPAVGAAVVFVLFALLFKEKGDGTTPTTAE